MIKLTNGERWVEVEQADLEKWLDSEYQYDPQGAYSPYMRDVVNGGRYGADGEYTLETAEPDIGWPFAVDEMVWTEERWKKSGRQKYRTAQKRAHRIELVEKLEAIGVPISPVVDRIKNEQLDKLLSVLSEKLLDSDE